MSLDWRIQFATTTVTDIPAAFPGGPSHPAGSTVLVASIVTPAEGTPIGFPAPSAAALALSIAAKASRMALAQRQLLRFGAGIAPSGAILNLDESTTGRLFDYFEQCLVAAAFSVQALESYSNYKIAQTAKGDVKAERRGQSVGRSPAEAERELSIDEKLGRTLPDLLGLASPKGSTVWEAYVHLRRLRDAAVHFKSHHQWTSSDRFDDSPYSWFMQHTPLEIPVPAINMLRHFAVEHEQAWLDGAERALAG
jgi:hypothetical protein